jgi:hypothetical protein
VTTERRPDERLPEHERRPETDLGAGLNSAGGTAPETGRDRSIKHADPDSIVDDQPTSDIEDQDPEDPNGPEAAYTPRSI